MKKCPFCHKGKVNITTKNHYLRILKTSLKIVNEAISRDQDEADQNYKDLREIIRFLERQRNG